MRRKLGIVGNTIDEGVGLQRRQTGFDGIEHFSRGPEESPEPLLDCVSDHE